MTKAILLNSPNNPTGAVYDFKELEDIATIALRKNFMIISGEAYEKIVYEGKHRSIASLPETKERVICVFPSLSPVIKSN